MAATAHFRRGRASAAAVWMPLAAPIPEIAAASIAEPTLAPSGEQAPMPRPANGRWAALAESVVISMRAPPLGRSGSTCRHGEAYVPAADPGNPFSTCGFLS